MNGHRPAAITTNGSSGSHVGPPGWQREQLPVLVMQVDPVLAPVLAVLDELEVPAGTADGTGASPGRVGTDHADRV